jgi:hypothetical protein
VPTRAGTDYLPVGRTVDLDDSTADLIGAIVLSSVNCLDHDDYIQTSAVPSHFAQSFGQRSGRAESAKHEEGDPQQPADTPTTSAHSKAAASFLSCHMRRTSQPLAWLRLRTNARMSPDPVKRWRRQAAE